MTVNVPENITAGQPIDIVVDSQSRKGQNVTVAITGSGPDQNVDVPIDQSGTGTVAWNVPNWVQVTFTDLAGKCPPVNRVIQ